MESLSDRIEKLAEGTNKILFYEEKLEELDLLFEDADELSGKCNSLQNDIEKINTRINTLNIKRQSDLIISSYSNDLLFKVLITEANKHEINEVEENISFDKEEMMCLQHKLFNLRRELSVMLSYLDTKVSELEKYQHACNKF